MAFSASSRFFHFIHKTHFITERQFNLSHQDAASGTLYPRRTKRFVLGTASKSSIEHQAPENLQSSCFQSFLSWIGELKGRHLPKTVGGAGGQTWNQTPGP